MHPKTCGLLIPVFSMRRERDHGVGDTLALTEWIDWAFDLGIGFLQLLPVNALGNDPYPSPYSSISSVALEPLYLTLEPDWLPGLEEVISDTPLDMPPLSSPYSPDLVDYPLVRNWKLKHLKRAFLCFREKQKYETERREFTDWIESQDNWLQDFVDYKVAAMEFGTDAWWEWPEQEPDKVRDLIKRHQKAKEFECWLQWLCDRQWLRVRAHADLRGIKLMGDVAIGVSMASSDVFFERDIFDTTWCGGAPAEGDFAEDPFTGKWGQNWGIPLYKWKEMEKKDNYAWWRRRISRTTRIFQMYRVDHIIGFYRIYAFPWMPSENPKFLNLSHDEAAKLTGGRLPQFKPRPDWSAEDQRENLNDGDRYLKMVLSAGEGAEVVGEDLGCVPDYVRPHMRLLNIPGFKIPHWEIMENGEILKGSEYHECSFATYATHDFPPISVTWNEIYNRILPGRKAEEANRQDEENPDLSPEDRWHRRQERQPMVDAMHDALRSLCWFADYCNVPRSSTEISWNTMVKTAMFHALLSCNSRLVALMYMDLFDLPVRLNTPGTVGGINWRPRVPFTAQEAGTKMQSIWMKRLIIQTGRGGSIRLEQPQVVRM